MKLFTKLKQWWKDSNTYCDEGGDMHEWIFYSNNHDYTSTEICKRCGAKITHYHPQY